MNQPPALDTGNRASVFWAGLSAVQFSEDEEKQPLAPNTRSGALIESIEQPLKTEYAFYKTNIVKCLPLHAGKIRYPVEHEMEKCFPNFEDEIAKFRPSVIFLLGKQVATFVLKKYDVKLRAMENSLIYEPVSIDNVFFVPVHHPSYILVYKRKMINDYMKNIRTVIKLHAELNCV